MEKPRPPFRYEYEHPIGEEANRDHYVLDADGHELACLRDEETARLFAAAPDLLAAAEALLEFWDAGTPVHPGAEAAQDLRIAVHKARETSEPLYEDT